MKLSIFKPGRRMIEILKPSLELLAIQTNLATMHKIDVQ